MYPVILDLTGKRCLVVGAGSVGRRKVSGLVAAGAVVRVVDPHMDQEFRKYASKHDLELFEREYQREDLQGVFLAFACTALPSLQERIAEDARNEGILLNSATDPRAGDFTLPAQLRHGDFLLTISTGGASPALARSLQKSLALEYGPEYGVLVSLLTALRPLVLAKGESSLANRKLFRDLLAEDLLGCIVRKEWQLLLEILEHYLPVDEALVELVMGLSYDQEVEKVRAFYE